MLTNDPVVLLVDDCKNNALLLRVVFERSGFVHPLQFASDGEEAIAYLRGEGRYGDRAQHPLPTLLLMDLNMPRKNGFETLQWIRQQPAFERLLVYILSASDSPEDIERAYALGANSYLVRPGNLAELMHLAGWLKLSHFAPLADKEEGRETASAGDRARQGAASYFKSQGSWPGIFPRVPTP